ncbi:helicase [Oryctes borbonicus]|uniref:Helicase n=1 Tax=Oryctes borbonicus TaxID=1629725 RepID=A0A0T6BCX3_9SCAR|nr:helicase [Oryctes borbonicus]
MYYQARIQAKLHHFSFIWKSFYGNSDKRYLKHDRAFQNVRSLCNSSKIVFRKELNTSRYEKRCKDEDNAKTELINYNNNSSNNFGNIPVIVKQTFKQNHAYYIFCNNILVTSNSHLTNSLRSLHTDSTNYIRHVKHAEDINIQEQNIVNHLKPKSQTNLNTRRHIPNYQEDFNSIDKRSSNIRISEHPKNVLNSFSLILSQELGKDFNITPVYSKHHNDWICTYHLKWPEPIKISKRARTKKNASHKAAVATLEWLTSQGKVDSTGKLVIYDAETIRAIYKKSNRKVLALDNTTIDNLNLIHEEYKRNLLQYLETSVENGTEKQNTVDLTNLENPWLLNFLPQRILDLKNYLAKEEVELPIQKYKNDIIELIKKNRIVIIKGETGCGKSIRVPQYVLEGWAKSGALDKEQCKIIVTQPRRIAAISLAERVAYEREEEVGRIVGYQVRFKTNFNKSMGRILYCTTGILLRRLQTDPSLIDCTHIIIDEAHERDVNTDLLMNLLRYAMEINSELKLIIMSATINTDIFKEYFEGAVVFSVPGRIFPVKEYYIDSSKIIDYEKTLKMCQSHEPCVVVEDVADTIKCFFFQIWNQKIATEC